MVARLTPNLFWMAATPAATSNVSAKPVSSGWVLVKWTDNATNESGVIIQRSMDGGAWKQVGAVGANVTFFDDTTASKPHSYSYRVFAYNGAGASAVSNLPVASVAIAYPPAIGNSAAAASTSVTVTSGPYTPEST